MWDLMKHKKIYLIISGVLLIPGIISLLLFGLNLSAEFTGGSVIKYKFIGEEQKYDEFKDNVKKVFEAKNIEVLEIYNAPPIIEIRTKQIETSAFDEVTAEIKLVTPTVEVSSFETIGPTIGLETTTNAFKALGAASLAIMLYIAYAFRNIPKPFSSIRFGISAIIAMLHDALLLIGVFSILGKFLNVQVDVLFMTATLTVIGFSVHDTIVVFDRIRENLKKLPTSWSFDQVVNYSIVETLNRSFATSLTVLVTLLSLFILGGESIRYFVFALLIGIISGTYSSIFTASPILIIWENAILKRKKKA